MELNVDRTVKGFIVTKLVYHSRQSRSSDGKFKILAKGIAKT